MSAVDALTYLRMNGQAFELEFDTLQCKHMDPAIIPSKRLYFESLKQQLMSEGAIPPKEFDRSVLKAFNASLPKTQSWDEYLETRPKGPIEHGH